MWKYIINDLLVSFRYLPVGIMAGALFAAGIGAVNEKRKKRGRKVVPVISSSCLCIYIIVLLMITFFSRESDSGARYMDLHLGSTWGINKRNNAFVVENVLLFIPYGILMPWAFQSARGILKSILIGLFSSLLVELLQLVTGRGYFQLDDILTNVAGYLIGSLIFLCGVKLYKLRR